MGLPFARRSAASVAAALVAALITPATAHGAVDPPHSAVTSAGHSEPRPATVKVTLITGDEVTATQGPGRVGLSVDAVERPPGATGSVRVAVEDGDTFVYPDEAMAYLAAGRLDKQLFDVTQLVAQGYDDAHAGALPLIVTRSEGSSALKSGLSKGSSDSSSDSALPGVETSRALPSVRGEAVRARRSKAAALWSALTDAQGQDSQRSMARAGAAPDDGDAPSFTAGIDKIWLDGKAEAALADTTAQIGAPSAWSAGGTGTGVRVAVLDSGVDATHPDLADRIVASRSFVQGEDVVDRNGHGTHTASTVAGTGAASGGKER